MSIDSIECVCMQGHARYLKLSITSGCMREKMAFFGEEGGGLRTRGQGGYLVTFHIIWVLSTNVVYHNRLGIRL